ncbi:MAG: nucleotidyltransferase family protein [Dermatophilaceae bacterium]
MSEQARHAADQLRALADNDVLRRLCTRLGIELLVLFGSAVSGEDPNDVDLAVRFARQSRPDLLALLDELYQLTRYEGFDVLDLARAGPLARERALVGAVPLHEARPGLFANTQIAAIMERLDTDEMRRVELALLAE